MTFLLWFGWIFCIGLRESYRYLSGRLQVDYVSHTQDEQMQRTQENLLSPRKMSVSRMHSLPNDSYMFRPVRPASAPYPLQEVEPTQAYLELGIC